MPLHSTPLLLEKKLKFKEKVEEIRSLFKQLEADNLPKDDLYHLSVFFNSYLKVVQSQGKQDLKPLQTFFNFLQQIQIVFQTPFAFPVFHKKITEPFNFYQLGLDFIEPLVDFKNSTLTGTDQLKKITSYLENGDNVVFLANHQVEADPQILGLFFKKDFPVIADKLIFVAGSKVTSDLLAIPFSMGCNLLCIYSKKYIDIPPEKKEEKQEHNKKTMHAMVDLFAQGGQAIYVAPSGGRDRRNSAGEVVVSDFDPSSVEMFFLMGKKSKKKTHFFPMALSTFHLLPPPESEDHELGEERVTQGGPVHIAILPELDEAALIQQHKGLPKKLLRQKKTDLIHSKIVDIYKQFPNK
ncbi:glycerol-3-phosphate acyltransferase [Candidatus Aerophobetes bacterium]|uniref:Glycerol-3-phosphate acyltransferase n=1 Tax=Aerophobetes bacterium TaxID=2030807 RepID=A0A2A4X7X0_UNCAE|nr:MAG: glycerol-3-phosphate acyltransferase [Candidatus Aerophobetes bacterium]